MKKLRFIFVIAILNLVGISSCKIKDTEPITTKKTKENIASIESYIKSKNISAQKTGAGLYYTLTKAIPTGRVPKTGDLLAFHFIISKLDGTKIDSTSTIKNTPILFPYLAVENAFYEAASVLKLNETATVFLTYDYAYGDVDRTNIPAYSPMKLDITLIKIRDEEEQIAEYMANAKLTPIKTGTGLQYAITTAVSGADALKNGQTVKVNYTGKLLIYSPLKDAENKPTNVFDSGSFQLVLGSGSAIKGFEEGISKLKVGEKGVFAFPSTIGYGDVGSSPKILPKTPLVFEIEIVSAN
jgi:FKBP-type peptidyl-prolyl cis-trans isomerase